VHDASDLDDTRMAAFARWTNLSETTFLLPPTEPDADYRVRIFTPLGELPFAGHPTIGSAWAWLAAGGVAKQSTTLVQECRVGLVRVQRTVVDGRERLAFAAPPLRKTGPLDDALLTRVCCALRIAPHQVLRHQWVDNGPGWLAVQLASAAEVRALQPDRVVMGELKIGVVGAHSPNSMQDALAFEVRAFFGGALEDPVTGSLNAGLAQWLIGAGLAPDRYAVSQGYALGRDGRVHVEREGATIWVGGDVTPLVEGTVAL
jgi:PhzF family phenazine biosynthesis protein